MSWRGIIGVEFALHEGMGVLVLFLAGGLLLLVLLISKAHFVGEETVIGVIRLFYFHLVVRLLPDGLIAPIDSKLGDPGFIDEDGPAGVGNEGGDICGGAFLLCEIIIEDVVGIVSNPNKLLISIADGYDDGSDT
jgi:hypothetical protein